MSKEAMKLALEALEYHQEQTRPIAKTKKTIAFLRAEIAKQECNCKQGQQCHICDPITIAKQEQGEPVALKVYRGELCYKSQADDQSFGMWCPVTQDLPFPEGTNFYTTSQPKQEQGEPDDEVLGFNGWGFPIQRHSKQKHDDPVVYSKEQMKIIAEANYDAGYTTGYMDSSVKAHDRKTLPVVWIHSDELEELSHCNGMSVWAENAQVHTEDSITNQLIPNGYLPLYTRPQPKQEQGELAATERQVEILTDELANCQRALEKQEQGEPVALETIYETIIHWDEGGGKRSRRELARRIVALYTTPQQRKPLTHEQVYELWLARFETNEYDDVFMNFARAIEAAHGIKE